MGSKTEKSIKLISLWAENQGLTIGEFLTEDYVSQKTAFEDRVFIKELLPRLQDGDIVIVSELSCIGRSASELDSVFNKKINKAIRIICVPIEMDIDYANMSPSNKSILEKIAFAAKLQSYLVREVTESALSAKKAKGVGLGAHSKKWIESFYSKPKEQRKKDAEKRGQTKTERFIASPDTQAFLKVLKHVFPTVCTDDNPTKWDWSVINTKGEAKNKILSLIKEYKDLDKSGKLFRKFDFSTPGSGVVIYMRAHLSNVRKSVLKLRKGKDDDLPQSKSTENTDVLSKEIVIKHKQQKREIKIDETQLHKIEQDTKVSHEILSEIFTETSTPKNEEKDISISKKVRAILATLLSKEVWDYKDVESLCNQHNLMIGSVLEQINDYSYSKIDDAVIEDDGETIYITTEYKNQLI